MKNNMLMKIFPLPNFFLNIRTRARQLKIKTFRYIHRYLS